jgi:hypothetical protein
MTLDEWRDRLGALVGAFNDGMRAARDEGFMPDVIVSRITSAAKPPLPVIGVSVMPGPFMNAEATASREL